jgi:pimeloyl-ACP methyl ester carboxylesterase
MEEYLHDRGYTVYSVSYSCVGSDIHACARNLEREAAWLIEETGSESLYVVAHSLGGVVLRWASTHTRMREWLTLGVTLGSPHLGTPTAHLAPARLPGFGRIVSQLRPGAHLTAGFDDQRGVRWVAIAGASDLVVPPKYARLPRATNVRNVLVPWCGHLTLTNNRQCLDIIREELEAAGGMASTMCATGEPATSVFSQPRSQCA